MKTFKKIIALLLAVCLLGSVSAFALNSGDARAVIGANLTEDQINSVYATFGVKRNDVKELTVTNSEERQYLDGVASSDVIGTRSISCVYIQITDEGSGLDVTTSNINWCTKQMYINALTTAGIDDAKVIIAAPFSVSGTAALTGIYKAYEDITGETISELAKQASTQELVITAELADEISEYDAVAIVNELKLILDETKNMTDDEIKEEIKSIAKEYNVSLTDDEISKLVSLCRSLEGLSSDELQAKVESVQSALKKVAAAKDTVGGVFEAVKNIFSTVGDFLSNTFGKLSFVQKIKDKLS